MESMQITGQPVKLKCNFGTTEAIGSVILWIILTIITLGIALLFFPYFMNKSVLNRTEVIDKHGRAVGRLHCEFNVSNSIGHVFIWLLLILVTLGLAGFLYVFRVLRVVLNETRIVYH